MIENFGKELDNKIYNKSTSSEKMVQKIFTHLQEANK